MADKTKDNDEYFEWIYTNASPPQLVLKDHRDGSTYEWLPSEDDPKRLLVDRDTLGIGTDTIYFGSVDQLKKEKGLMARIFVDPWGLPDSYFAEATAMCRRVDSGWKADIEFIKTSTPFLCNRIGVVRHYGFEHLCIGPLSKDQVDELHRDIRAILDKGNLFGRPTELWTVTIEDFYFTCHHQELKMTRVKI